MLNKCGKYLGEGYRRVVYEHLDNPDLVIKFLKNLDDNHNRVEWENWQNLKDTQKGESLAPCISISEDSRFLVQQRVKLLVEAPENVEEWLEKLGDWKKGGNDSIHWGTLNGKNVLVDYGDKQLWNT